MNKPQSYNNPFALIQAVPDSWQGLVSGSTGFLRFVSPYYGLRAGMKNLKNTYLSRGLNTIEKIFPVYAPLGHGENNPSDYISFVESFSGVPRYRVLHSDVDIFNVCRAIVRFEEGAFWVTESDFKAAFHDVFGTFSFAGGSVSFLGGVVFLLVFFYALRLILAYVLKKGV